MNFKNTILFTSFLLCLASYAQKSKPNFDRLYQKMEEFQYTNQDSCKYYLDVLNGYKKSMPDTIYGKLLNDYGIYYGMHDKKEMALRYFNKSVTLFPDNDKQNASVYKNIANVYKIDGQYQKAIYFLNKSSALFKKIGDEKSQFRVLGEISANYFYLAKYDVALQTSLTVIENLERLNDTTFVAMQMLRLGNIYSVLNREQDAIQVFKKCLVLFKDEKNEQRNYYRTMLNLGDCYSKLKKDKEAKASYDKAGIGLLDLRDYESAYIAKSKLGEIYAKEGNSQKAIENLKPAFDYMLSIESPTILLVAIDYINALVIQKKYVAITGIINTIKIESKSNFSDNDVLYYYEKLIDFYKITNDKKNELDFLRKAYSLKDKIYELDSKIKAKEIAQKYDSRLLLQKNKTLSLDNELLKTRTYSIIVVLFLIIVIIGYFFTTNRNKLVWQKTNVKLLQKEKLLLSRKKQIEHENLKLANELLEVNEREISALSLELLNIQNSINSILSDGNEINTKVLKKKINIIFNNKDYWKIFKLKFTQIHPDFDKKIGQNFPNLTAKDIDFCSLIKLKLSNKEISMLTNISYESVISKRYLLRKKMNFSSDNDMMLYFDSI